MRLVKVFVSVLMGAMTACVIVTVGAYAEAPEYGRCVTVPKIEKKYGGTYVDKGCTKAATTIEKEEGKKNKYEWLPGGVKLHQTSTGGKAVLQEAGKYAVGCSAESSTGEYFGAKEVRNLIVKFTGCKVPPYVCNSPGHAEGELETKELEGRMVWKNEAKREAAFDLYPAHGEELFIKFNCGELTVKVRGSLLVAAEANKMKTSFKLKYKEKGGLQEVKFYEEDGVLVEDILEADFEEKGWAKSGQSITSTVKNEEALELNTYV